MVEARFPNLNIELLEEQILDRHVSWQPTAHGPIWKNSGPGASAL